MLPIDLNRFNLPKNWIVLGDSVSKGIVFDEAKGRYVPTPKNFINQVADFMGVAVKNISMYGATVLKGLQLWDRFSEKLPEPGLCIMEFGGNDCDYLWSEISEEPDKPHWSNVPPERFIEAYRELIEKVKAKGWTPVILSLPPLDAARYFETLSKKLDKSKIMYWLGGTTQTIYQWHESYNAALPNLAEATGSIFLDIRQPFLQRRHPGRFICADGIHPNEEGHNLIAAFLLERLGCPEAARNMGPILM